MSSSSEEQVFARVDRIRRRAQQLLDGRSPGGGPGAATTPADLDPDARGASVGAGPRLTALARRCDLPPLAVDALLCLLAAEYDPALRRLVRATQGDVGNRWLEIGTIAELLDLAPRRLPELGRLLSPRGALRRAGLVIVDTDGPEAGQPLVSARVRIAPRIAAHLVGDDSLADGLRLVSPCRPTLDRSLARATDRAAVLRRIRHAHAEARPLIVAITGAPGTGRRFLAEGLAAEVGRPLLVCDLSVVQDRHLAERLADVRRELRLTDAIACLSGLDLWARSLDRAESEAVGPLPADPPRLPPAVAEFLEDNEGILVVTSAERAHDLEQRAGDVVEITVPFPSPTQRADLLAGALREAGAELAPDVDLHRMARRYPLDPERIGRAAAHARAIADGNGAPRVGDAELHGACRAQQRHDLGGLATRVTASHRWEDLVVTVDVYDGLREMIARARHGARVLDEWGFGARHSLSSGLSALFAGPPGTGKTMCASVLSRELDMDLLRVDLSRIVSGRIGETERNLGRVFDEAERSSAILLFEEADAVFARRGDVKSSSDRHTNLEVNFLLQRMDRFPGVTILTTDFEDTIDAAFKRRLTFRLRFEKPDADARAALWRKMFPADCRLDDDVDFARLGALFEMSGGHIRNAAVRAAFLAADSPDGREAIDMDVILTAAERESREMGLLTRSFDHDEAAPFIAVDVPDAPAAAPPPRSPGGIDRTRPVALTRPRNPVADPEG